MPIDTMQYNSTLNITISETLPVKTLQKVELSASIITGVGGIAEFITLYKTSSLASNLEMNQ